MSITSHYLFLLINSKQLLPEEGDLINIFSQCREMKTAKINTISWDKLPQKI